jgi:hypothetical protein
MGTLRTSIHVISLIRQTAGRINGRKAKKINRTLRRRNNKIYER